MHESVEIERVVAPTQIEVDEQNLGGPKIRPQSFDDYPGQEQCKENLKVYVKAALNRQKTIDHIILHGPPGLGKTTLAHIVANELGVPFYATSGPSIDKPGDLAGIIAGLEQGALLFIDEIHRLTIQVEEVLYGAMEDFCLDLVVGQGSSARSVRMPIAPFTLVGATTKLSSLSRPFLSRFGIQEKLSFYSDESLTEIVMRSARILELEIDDEAAKVLAMRSRGTPRIANRLLRRVADFAEVGGKLTVDKEIVELALHRLGINSKGLDEVDRNILSVLKNTYGGGPVGIEALSVSLGEERSTIEEVYEPFLVHKGFLKRGPRGRSLGDLEFECDGEKQ